MARLTTLDSALGQWRQVLGEEWVLTDPVGIQPYHPSTILAQRDIPAVLRPGSGAEVATVVRIAGEHQIPLYPISAGHNWGYGSANPVTDGCVLVDLSRMRSIDDRDIELGVVTVEPGVTQQALRNFLDQRGQPFLVPVHGGGPQCSLVGNALERGYGITPYADHFAAVTALEAVLPDGTLYRSALTELGAATVDRTFKWGVGPYLDGLFSQANLGIVTRMSIALAPQPERIETFFFSVPDHAELTEIVVAIRDILRSVGTVTGSINLMNARRVLSMMTPYPTDQIGADCVLPDETVRAMAKHAQVMPWTGIGALYGTTKIVKAARSAIRRRLKGRARRLIFVTPRFVNRARRTLERLPGKGGQRVWTYVSTLDKSLKLIAGSPSEVALPLAYWKARHQPDPNRPQPLNPAADGCGLIWYSPLVPMTPERVRDYVEMVDRVCREHGIEPLITLTSLSERCFDSTVPLLFDREDTQAAKRAHRCYAALLSAGQTLGCVPYRASIESMPWFTGAADSSHWQLVRRIKTALDPDGLIAPGRYCPR